MKKNGFTLIELMISMVLSLIVVAGSGVAYIGVSSVINLSKQIENTQEVLRYTSNVFSRSLKQTMVSPVSNTPDTISITQDKLGSVACDGTTPLVAPYVESFRFEQPNLYCDAGNGEVIILKQVESLSIAINGNLVQITVRPEEFPMENLPNGVRIDIALSSKILMEETN